MTAAPHQRLNKMETTSIFEQMTKEFLDYHPQLDYQWISNNKILGVKFTKKTVWDSMSFGEINKNENILLCRRSPSFITMFNSENSTFLFGMLRDLLSKNMRILEKHAEIPFIKLLFRRGMGKAGLMKTFLL